MFDHVYIIIPAKNEAARIGKVIGKSMELGYRNVIVIDDGSHDNTAEVALSYQATVLHHLVNLGPGAATQTGIEHAIKQGAKIIVTIDADHQQFPEDIEKMVHELETKDIDVVIGSRFMNRENQIPFIRIVYNMIANVITFILTGLMVTDSQSGMKAFKADFARKCHLHFNGFEFCVEFIRNIRVYKATHKEVPIRVIYTKDTLSKGQNLLTGIRMLAKLFKFI